MFATNFAGYECRVQIGKYADGAIRLDLVSEEGPIATATAFIGGGLGDGEVAVKTWSENVGMDLALLLAGVIEPGVVGKIPCGYAVAPVHRLTPAARKAAGL